MFAQLEFDPAHDQKTKLVIYRTAQDATDRRCPNWLMRFDLTNEQLSEFVVMKKIKVVNTNE